MSKGGWPNGGDETVAFLAVMPRSKCSGSCQWLSCGAGKGFSKGGWKISWEVALALPERNSGFGFQHLLQHPDRAAHSHTRFCRPNPKTA